MKVEVKNLGIIKEAELEIKPFTVIIGPNNTCKTWLMYAIYEMMGESRIDNILLRFLQSDNYTFKTPLKKNFTNEIEKFIESREINIIEFIDKNIKFYLQELGYLFTDPLFKQLMASMNLPISKDIGIKFKFTQKEINRHVKFIKNEKWDLEEGEYSIFEEDFEKIYIYRKENSPLLKISPAKISDINNVVENNYDEVKLVSYERIFDYLSSIPATHKYIFPAERKTLSQTRDTILRNPSSKMLKQNPNLSVQEFADLQKESKKNAIVFPKPLHDYLDMLRALNVRHRTGRKSDYNKYSDILEKSILKGKVDIEGGPEIGYSTVFKPDGLDNSLMLHTTSTMVKSLGSIDLYLKYLANENDTIFIDEPEMNLHPEAQVKLTEFFGVLVNNDINIICTTHTPYIVQHLQNLVKGYEKYHANADNPEKQAKIKERLWLKNEKALLHPNQVAVYQIDETGNVMSIFDYEDNIIEWDTFSDISADLVSIEDDFEEL